MEITRDQLVDALQEFHLWITPDPAHKDVGRRCVVGTVQDPESMADGLLLALRANAAHGDVVDAHVCCEHAGVGDRELLAMAALTPALPMVSALGHDARERVMDWARRRACDGLAPF